MLSSIFKQYSTVKYEGHETNGNMQYLQMNNETFNFLLDFTRLIAWGPARRGAANSLIELAIMIQSASGPIGDR